MNMPDLSQLHGTDGIMAAVALYAARMISKMEKSVSRLNGNMAKVLEKTSWHEKELGRHDKEIEKLKRRS